MIQMSSGRLLLLLLELDMQLLMRLLVRRRPHDERRGIVPW